MGFDFDSTRAFPVYDWMGVAKSALQSVSRFLARDLGARGIRVNLVAAGPSRSLAARSIPGYEVFEDVWNDRAPLGWDTRDADPIAKACVALAVRLVPRHHRRDRPRRRRLPRHRRLTHQPASAAGPIPRLLTRLVACGLHYFARMGDIVRVTGGSGVLSGREYLRGVARPAPRRRRRWPGHRRRDARTVQQGAAAVEDAAGSPYLWVDFCRQPGVRRSSPTRAGFPCVPRPPGR